MDWVGVMAAGMKAAKRRPQGLCNVEAMREG
jgi:hypothetical protein